MESSMSTQEQQLCQFLMKLPSDYKYRYTEEASRDLLINLFWSMAAGKAEYMSLFFPQGAAFRHGNLRLKEAQGAVEGAEYTEAARGKACGHIFMAGEASYACRTCSTDDTCCLCSKCFDATDHTGHMVRISISPGNSGCCDCGDPEAWKKPMFCTIHSLWEGEMSKGKGRLPQELPEDLRTSIRMTIGRVFDYMCDVISCSPEQLRQVKTVESIEQDERMSRLSSAYCGGDVGNPEEYAVLLWNDEKHTIVDVRDQVARACRTTGAEGMMRAYETDAIGRSLIKFDSDIRKLLQVAAVLEKIRVTVTIRSSRDTFREQMCGTMIEWLRDISGCTVGSDERILLTAVCEEMLKPWRKGSPATHAVVGKDGIDDEDFIERDERGDVPYFYFIAQQHRLLRQTRMAAQQQGVTDRASDEDDEDDEADEADEDDEDGPPSSGGMDEDGDEETRTEFYFAEDVDTVMPDWEDDQALETAEATAAGFPPPPPPPPPPHPAGASRGTVRERELTPSDSDTAEPLVAPAVYAKTHLEIPKTPGLSKGQPVPPPHPGQYWLITPAGYVDQDDIPVSESIFERVRLDWLVLFDLRMWKKVRNDLRSLYISTVVTIPAFKRVLGLRFAGLYTTLAQLYLIGDREPDHSIINISLQMLTTPSITAEVVERGNFLTSLMAILYTFLTTRQVGHPWDVASNAVLDFDKGSVTNRRMYHFFQDLKYLFGSAHVQERLRVEERYMMQFLDLVKLHQGICPNVRAVGEHVEYETDGWIGASLVTREINRLCRQFSESFRNAREEDGDHVMRAIRTAAKAVIINSIGAERARFAEGEIKDEVRFKSLSDFEFEPDVDRFEVVRFVVEDQPISFHHALHYTLSWLIECGKSMPVGQLKALLTFTTQELAMRPRSMGKKQWPRREFGPEDHLVAAFDYPLRVCAWLAQMKAGMWVRNGLSLRHQAGTYRGVGQRDVSHHRDIFLLQVALVVCNPSRILASAVDRFGMEKWVKGIFEQKSQAQDDVQHLDVIEDMVHLLIVLLSDRTSLMPSDQESSSHVLSMRRDITHVLCFKPLSFNDICNKLPDRFQEQEDFHRILDDMTTFKSPEGLSDVGTFELKAQYIRDVDPYIAHYNKNQREESEMAWRKLMAKTSGKRVEDVVFEPTLRPISSGVFAGLARFTGTGMFAQIVYYALLYALVSSRLTPTVPLTRVETFLQVVLHLMLLAISEDRSQDGSQEPSFVRHALMRHARSNFMPDAPQAKTIAALLNLMAAKDEYKACHAKIGLILERMRQKRPHHFETAYHHLGLPVDRVNTSAPAYKSAGEEREKKKRAALDRQAKVMAQFQAQQKSFMENQGDVNWGDVDDLEDEELPPAEEHKNFWKYPSGTCILCQEDTDDRRLYGTFAFISQSHILRQTDFQDGDFVREVFNTPENLDRSAEAMRPFGVAHENRQMVEKVNAAGEIFLAERQAIGKGFPAKLSRSGPVAIGCGHMMHYRCFETYFDATVRRHGQQIARHAPEDVRRHEFVCPLCKALGNAFLPIIWRGQEESYPGPLQSSAAPFSDFLEAQMHSAYYTLGAARPPDQVQDAFAAYASSMMTTNLAERSSQLLDDAWVDVRARPRSTGTAHGETTLASTYPAVSASESSTASASARPGTTADDDDDDDNSNNDNGSSSNNNNNHNNNNNNKNNSIVRELVAVYRRLRETLRKNGLRSRHEPPTRLSETPSEELQGSDVLARCVGYSISAVEIQQRGVEAEYGATFLEKIPDQVLIQLRILAETVRSYIAVGGLREAGENHIDQEYRRDSERQHCQLFMAQYLGEETELTHSPMDSYRPLLSEDPFVFLCECVFGVKEAQKMEIAHLVRLCYLAEITKVVYQLGRNMPAMGWVQRLADRPQDMDPALANFAAFCEAVFRLDVDATSGHSAFSHEPSSSSSWSSSAVQARSWPPSGENRAFDQPGMDSWEAWYSFVQKYALVFLRKSVVMLYTCFGVDFNSRVSPNPEQKELDRLTEALRVPSFDEMVTALTPLGPQAGWSSPDTLKMVGGWVQHQASWSSVLLSSGAAAAAAAAASSSSSSDASSSDGGPEQNLELPPSAMVSHPGIFELVGLPRNYDTLIELCTRRRCPTKGKDVSDPMMCLFCGDVFCGQAICCTKDEKIGRGRPIRIGGAQQHLKKCQKNIGLFINIRKCCVFYLHRGSGAFGTAPYIDKYGEVDMHLRHGRQLHLHQRRYDSMLRSLWLGHGIPSFIARRLEADINNGGWETI